MKIDRVKAEKVFNEYSSKYDSSDEKIKLKIDHTYRVSSLCERIAENLNLSRGEIDIAWLMGLLHDIGRFEQVRRYGTFNDAQSVNHAHLAVEILFDENMIREFIDDDSEDELIKNAINYHNAYEVPLSLCDRTIMFTNILRDADKIDIFKVNSDISIEDIYNVTKEEVLNSVITEEVMNELRMERTVLRKLKKTPVDNIADYTAFIFGLVYDISVEITKEQGYLEKIISFESLNPKTKSQFEEIRYIVHRYMQKRLIK